MTPRNADFPHTSPSSRRTPSRSLRAYNKTMEMPLDPFDRKILEFVQRDCQVNAEVIAEAVGLSASAVQRRLRRLRTDKVITAEVALVDPRVVGQRMQFIAGIELKDNYEALPRIRAWVQKEPEVQQLFYVTGAVDLVMVILSKSVKEYDALSARLMSEVPQVIRMTTNVVIDAMKSDHYVPVDD
jgi:Lrp/AsnC family leucine-responsive transcriptional regulator